MELNDVTFLNFVESLSKILPCPAAFFEKNGRFLGCTHPSENQLAIHIFQKCMKSPETSQKTAALYNAAYTVLQTPDNEYVCSLLLLGVTDREDLYQPILALLMVHLQSQELQRQLIPDSGERISFVYQLLSSRNASADTLRAKALQMHYVIHVPRAAILFLLNPFTIADDALFTDFSTGESQDIFFKTLSRTPGHCSEDIGDFMNSSAFTLLKSIPQSELNDPKGYLSSFIDSILNTMIKISGLGLRVCIGSCYDNLLDLRKSYEEALFLSHNYDFLAASNNQILFIEDHIYDYLISLVPKSYYNEKFSDLIAAMCHRPALHQTLIALSQHNINLKASASALGLHRNTMLQRYEKLKTELEIDPANNDRDRMTIRQYALCFRKKTTLCAGVIIQNSNVLSSLYRKFAEQIYQNSDGEMELDYHTLSFSGDNKLLFDLLRHGELDIGIGNPDSLIPLIGEQISVVNAPFLFDSAKQALSLLNSQIGQELLGPLKDYGLIKLAFWSMGWRYFSSSKDTCIRLPSDLKGQQIRIMKKPLMDSYMKYLGANPCFISYDKILPALEEGLIDMQENPYRNFYEMHFYRQQKNLLEMEMMFDSNVLLVNSRVWNQLTPAQQEILRHSADETTRWNRDRFLPMTTDCREKILKKGVSIHLPTPEEEAIWRKSAKKFLMQSPYYETAEKIERFKFRYQEKLK